VPRHSVDHDAVAIPQPRDRPAPAPLGRAWPTQKTRRLAEKASPGDQGDPTAHALPVDRAGVDNISRMSVPPFGPSKPMVMTSPAL